MIFAAPSFFLSDSPNRYNARLMDASRSPDLTRAVVIGTSGAGKTTFARALAERMGVPHIEFDAYRHGPNWTETPDDVLRRRVSDATSGGGWVADGNYSVVRDIVWRRAAAVVWLDYPFPLVFWRLFWRTVGRSARREELWNGNREQLWRHFFTKDSLFLWALRTHRRRKRGILAAFDMPEYRHLTIFRLRTPAQARRLLKSERPTAARDD